MPVGIDITRGNSNLVPNPEQRVAVLLAIAMICTLLGAFIERRILDNYIEDGSLRKRVFAAAALLPRDKNSLDEAFALTKLLDSPPQVLEKTKEEMRQAGYDPDHAKVGYKFFIEWLPVYQPLPTAPRLPASV